MRLLCEFFDLALEGPADLPLSQAPAKVLKWVHPSDGSVKMRFWNITHFSNDLPVPSPAPSPLHSTSSCTVHKHFKRVSLWLTASPAIITEIG